MIKRKFRMVGQMPNHIFFDNNCSLKRHVKDDPAFANVGLPCRRVSFQMQERHFLSTELQPCTFP
jgi:hypothetical protein